MVCNIVPDAELIFAGLKSDAELPDIPSAVLPQFPAVDMAIFMDLPSIKMDDLTEGKTNGSGVFDKLMTSVTAHLDRERAAGRITNNEFAKSYTDFSAAALNAAIQFLLTKDSAHWQALAAQTQAKLALVELAKAGVELQESKYRMALMAYQADGAQAQAALTKTQLAVAQGEHCVTLYRLENILPKEAEILTKQKDQLAAAILQTTAQTTQITQTTNTLLPQQVRGASAQADGQVYTTTYLLPLQKDQLVEQNKMIKEQTEAQRAQTMDTRTDNVTPVTGTLGKQKELHAQQIISYQRDSQLKAARPFIDAWITMKTIDEGTLPPTGFNNANLDQVLAILRRDGDLM